MDKHYIVFNRFVVDIEQASKSRAKTRKSASLNEGKNKLSTWNDIDDDI